MAKFEVAKGTASKMKEEADVYARELSLLRHLVPTENEVPALLESVSTAARRANLELSDVQPDGVVNGDQFNTYRYKMAVSGPYHEVAQFLSNVGSLSRIVEPINVTLALANRTGERRMKKNEQLLDAHFQIQTYVARTSNTDMPPATGTAGAP
jgi:type IV pilus assembly protein PilO